ncbi:hypothetical protein ABIF63_003593 [Bradyrhizobium japonicum]|uniref:Uncharacterized protein n=1 Tax=Bradyrhizobium japonicum TaxID=375 RepID=A0ABV2RT13_BRAJP|nr:hypothetical protein [Bradyrhizobium japonicum]UQD97178.1 hypothetical protein JEY30_37680 [Bradyrhizobium japonicum]WLB17286.1 hypothetical protein QIH95_35560 [Bradyrhizobium japonicum]
MGYFSQEALDDLKNGLAELPPQLRKLKASYASRAYGNDQAREYAQHGLSRRLSTMVQMVETVFELLPPELEDVPELITVMAATACIQNFVMNAFGCLENLAWIWVLEKNVRGKGGAELGRFDIGLGKPYVRKSFSAEFQAFLDEHKEWLGNLISFRDGLAHRIPLYIPPYVIDEASAEQFKTLDAAAIAAALAGDQAEYDRLRGEQKALGKFRPWMTHSVLDGAPTIIFHKQMLHDYVTVDAYCWTLIEEFAR